MANVKQAQQMIPLITREITFGQQVNELVVGVNIFDLDFGVQINSTNSLTQLCGFGIRVSLSGSFP